MLFRSLTAWLGNELQTEAFSQLYALEEKLKNCNDDSIKRDWLRLQNSDHFYYMCTKWFSDGAVHKYFNPYNGPYEAFINYMNVLTDFSIRVNELCKAAPAPVIESPAKEIVEKISKMSVPEKVIIVKEKPVKDKVKEKKKPVEKKKKAVNKKTSKTKPAKVKEVKKEILTFTKIVDLPSFVLKELVKKINVTTLCHALKTADEEFKDTLLSFLGIRKLKDFEEEINKNAKVSSNDIQIAQKEILDKAEILSHKRL